VKDAAHTLYCSTRMPQPLFSLAFASPIVLYASFVKPSPPYLLFGPWVAATNPYSFQSPLVGRRQSPYTPGFTSSSVPHDFPSPAIIPFSTVYILLFKPIFRRPTPLLPSEPPPIHKSLKYYCASSPGQWEPSDFVRIPSWVP